MAVIMVFFGGLAWCVPHADTPQDAMDALGYIPEYVSPDDPRPAAEQLQDNYPHGGWRSFKARCAIDARTGSILYPGDPPLRVVAVAKLRDETIRLHENAWISITQPDGAFDVSHMD